jgi:hypothetical protein
LNFSNPFYQCNLWSRLAPRFASWAPAYFWKKFPYFCTGSVGKKVLLKTPPVAKKEIRRPLVNNVSRQQIECRIDIAKSFGVDKAVFPLSRGAFGLVEKPSEVLTRCLAVPRLVSAADDDVQACPTFLAKIVAPAFEEGVQLFEFDAHGQLCNFECV